jgi:hypothetical protein
LGNNNPQNRKAINPDADRNSRAALVCLFAASPFFPPEFTLRQRNRQLSLIEIVNALLGKVVATSCSDYLTECRNHR